MDDLVPIDDFLCAFSMIVGSRYSFASNFPYYLDPTVLLKVFDTG